MIGRGDAADHCVFLLLRPPSEAFKKIW